MLQTKEIEYHDGSILLKGYYAFDETKSGKRPAVLVAHDWSGRNEFALEKANKLAELGYVGFALDMYGAAKLGHTNEEKMELMKPLMEDREALSRRMISALNTVISLEPVDPNQIAAIGFCFGGLCVLDLARRGAAITGVVSFHGSLKPPTHPNSQNISAKVLVLHGFDDPMVSAEDVNALEQEMTKADIDWQLHVYGGTMHAFMNPLANDPEFGTVYNPIAEKRAWIAMQNFFQEIFV